jgi:hypothetical protein
MQPDRTKSTKELRMSTTSTTTPTYLGDFVHPQLAAWEKEDLAATAWAKAEDDAYTAANEAVRLLENAAKRYRYDHETLPISDRRPHEDRASDMFSDAREAARAARQRWPDGPPNVQWRALEARRAMRAEAESALRLQLASLSSIDEELLRQQQRNENLRRESEALEKQLANLRESIEQGGKDALSARVYWREAADAVGFTGDATVDLPWRLSGEKRAMRYEKSLILGINSTERDVAIRESFERAATHQH